MKFLKTKQEISQALNLGKYPVLTMDIANAVEMGGKVVGFTGSKVRTNQRVFNGVTLFDKCELRWFEDTKKFTLSEQSVCVSSNYSYYDLIIDSEYANAPIVNKNQKVVIVLHNSSKRQPLAVLLVNIEEKEQIDLFKIIETMQK